MRPGKAALAERVLAASLCLLATAWPLQAAAADIGSSASLTEAIDAQFQQLSLTMQNALSSDDADAIARGGQQLHAFKVAANSELPAHNQWRIRKLELWLAAVDGVRSKFDPTFDSHDAPTLNLTPMTKNGIGSNSGMDPAAIKDKDVADDYKRRLAANAEKAASHDYQLTLRRLDLDWTGELLRHVAAQYTNDSPDRAEIRSAIETKVLNADNRASLRALLLGERSEGSVLSSNR